jgi:sulfatase modifying factor 1
MKWKGFIIVIVFCSVIVVALIAPETITPVPKEWTEPVINLEFVWIEGGCFEMGQSEIEKQQLIAETNEANYKQYFTDELPQHRVCVQGFWMAKTEITNAQYRQWKPDHDSLSFENQTMNEDDQPVVDVSWNEVQGFIGWLKGENKGGGMFRLPTEAEWEYACRAGTTTVRFWGDDPHQACQYANVGDQTGKKYFGKKWPDWTIHECDDGYAVTAPVGKFRPNNFGLHDMLGNVWEWCADVYVADIYAKHQQQGTVENPLVTDGGSQRVARGGCWSKQPRHTRCASRHAIPPDTKSDSVGFRLVRTE